MDNRSSRGHVRTFINAVCRLQGHACGKNLGAIPEPAFFRFDHDQPDLIHFSIIPFSHLSVLRLNGIEVRVAGILANFESASPQELRS